MHGLLHLVGADRADTAYAKSFDLCELARIQNETRLAGERIESLELTMMGACTAGSRNGMSPGRSAHASAKAQQTKEGSAVLNVNDRKYELPTEPTVVVLPSPSATCPGSSARSRRARG